MSAKLRYVFDTNTLVSALLFKNSKPGLAFRKALKNGNILLSTATIEELVEVLQREKFSRYITSQEIEEFIESLIDKQYLLNQMKKYRHAGILKMTSSWNWQ
jgi:putative PIN family toxin of toxin-antitoxin system